MKHVIDKVLELNLNSNPLREINKNIANLKSLEVLCVDHTLIEAVPEEILDIQNLNRFTVSSPNLEVPPPEICLKGLKDIK